MSVALREDPLHLGAPILNVCITRWVENIEGWERFTLSHPFSVQMCEVIIYGDSSHTMYNDISGYALIEECTSDLTNADEVSQ